MSILRILADRWASFKTNRQRMENFIELNTDNINSEHICCAISDKKCADSYQAKKDWLKQELTIHFRTRKLSLHNHK